MFWKLVISALVLPTSIALSSATVQASTNSKVSFLDQTSSQNLGTVEKSPQLIATYHNNCSYGYRSNHSGHGGGHHNNNHGGGHSGGYHNNSYGGHGGGHHNNRHGGGHSGGNHNNNHGGGHGGGNHNNNHGGGHGGGNHNNNYYNQGYDNH
jgi:hypothetical protein